jgi:hypothetical protein
MLMVLCVLVIVVPLCLPNNLTSVRTYSSALNDNCTDVITISRHDVARLPVAEPRVVTLKCLLPLSQLDYAGVVGFILVLFLTVRSINTAVLRLGSCCVPTAMLSHGC